MQVLGSHGEGVKDLKIGKLDYSLFLEQIECPYFCACGYVCEFALAHVKGQFNYLLP